MAQPFPRSPQIPSNGLARTRGRACPAEELYKRDNCLDFECQFECVDFGHPVQAVIRGSQGRVLAVLAETTGDRGCADQRCVGCWP